MTWLGITVLPGSVEEPGELVAPPSPLLQSPWIPRPQERLAYLLDGYNKATAAVHHLIFFFPICRSGSGPFWPPKCDNTSWNIDMYYHMWQFSHSNGKLKIYPKQILNSVGNEFWRLFQSVFLGFSRVKHFFSFGTLIISVENQLLGLKCILCLLRNQRMQAIRSIFPKNRSWNVKTFLPDFLVDLLCIWGFINMHNILHLNTPFAFHN